MQQAERKEAQAGCGMWRGGWWLSVQRKYNSKHRQKWGLCCLMDREVFTSEDVG